MNHVARAPSISQQSNPQGLPQQGLPQQGFPQQGYSGPTYGGGQRPNNARSNDARRGPGPNKAGIIVFVVLTLSVVVRLGLLGVERYQSSAKSAEAKNRLVAIGNAVVATYDKDGHKLCGSAAPVPASVPKGVKAPPGDADMGSESKGWQCLHFTDFGPSYYRYEYHAGGDYKGPSRGGPDPGPNGFEVSAQGDLDGNGVTSLITLTGKLDGESKHLELSPGLFVSRERE